jgi:serine/threonine-protein kinase
MSYETRTQPYSRRSSTVLVAFFTSLFTALIVTVAVLWLTGNLQSSRAQDESQVANKKLRKVPSLIGLTTETAADLLRSRDLRMVVGGEQPDPKVPKGKVAEQDPLADSELVKGGEVKVIVSSGVKKQKVPPVVGKPLEEAKGLLAAKGLTVGKVLETGEGDPGTVTEVQPGVGAEVADGSEVTLTISPAGTPVPDVVGSYRPKAKKLLEEAGFKVGKIRWGYNDYKDYNVVIKQEPEAGTIAPLETAVDLTVNDEE